MDKDTSVTDAEEHRFWRMTFDKRLDGIESRLDASFTSLKDSIEDLRTAAVKGFPEDDPLSHRRVHEGYIAEAESRKKIRQEILLNVLKGSVWAALVFICTAVWSYIKGSL